MSREDAIGYESPFILLSKAIQQIAEALEAKGWPAAPSGAAATEGALEKARYDSDRAQALFERAAATAKRNPAFEPSIAWAAGVISAAKRRLDSANARHRESLTERCQLGSRDEALRQLWQACRDGQIKAIGDFARVHDNGSVAAVDVSRIGVEIPAVVFGDDGIIQRFGRGDEIETPWGSGVWIKLRYRTEEIDRIWLYSSAAQVTVPADVPRPAAEAGDEMPFLIDRLAEWIFARHEECQLKEQLFGDARRVSELGTFRRTDFAAAFQNVYATEARRPPATGWPLQPKYQLRASARKVSK
jgi:hypothetical protein